MGLRVVLVADLLDEGLDAVVGHGEWIECGCKPRWDVGGAWRGVHLSRAEEECRRDVRMR